VIGGDVVWSGHLLGQRAAVGGRVDDAEQLRVDVLVLLARVRVGRVHVLRHPVRHVPLVGTVLRPLRDRVGELFAEDPLEGLDLPRLVQAPQKVVEGTVLEHDHDDVVERAIPVSSVHSRGSLD
jgi:hypothetical protein